MKTIFAVLAAITLAGCEYNVREERGPRPYDPYDGYREPEPTPMPSSPPPRFPPPSNGTSTTSDASAAPSEPKDDDAGAEPAIECDGLERCRAITTRDACEAELGCWVVPR